MNIDRQTLLQIAHLARLEFEESSAAQMMHDMNSMLGWLEKLHELDTEGVEPLTHMSAELNVLSADVPEKSLPHAQAMKNAPTKEPIFFLVPKVLE